MPYDDYRPEVDLGQLISAPFAKCLVPPNKAGTYPSGKNGRQMLAPDWRHLVFGGAAETDRAVLAYDELPHVAEVRLGRVRLLCPFDFLLSTATGLRLVAFDVPGLEPHETGLLLGLAARVTRAPIVHVTDRELRAYVSTGRFPASTLARRVPPKAA